MAPEATSSLLLPRLYAITDREVARLSHLEQVRALLTAGVRLIQLREKRLSANEFYEEARACVGLAHRAGAHLIINDRVDIALASGADGVHLGQDDIPPEYARRLMGEHRLIGLSTHTVDQALEADGLPVDYLAVGPIFPTYTGEKTFPVVGFDDLRKICSTVTKPVVAIGGIKLENATEVLGTRARTVAVISGLVGVGNIEERARAFLSRVGND